MSKSIDSNPLLHSSEKSPSVLNRNTLIEGSFISNDENSGVGNGKVMLDINVISSNLIYVATVLNYEFIKKRIKEVDLESIMQLSQLEDSSDDFFLLYDLYKIYLFCVKRVIIEFKSSDGSADVRHEQFLSTIQDTFFQ